MVGDSIIKFLLFVVSAKKYFKILFHVDNTQNKQLKLLFISPTSIHRIVSVVVIIVVVFINSHAINTKHAFVIIMPIKYKSKSKKNICVYIEKTITITQKIERK